MPEIIISVVIYCLCAVSIYLTMGMVFLMACFFMFESQGIQERITIPFMWRWLLSWYSLYREHFIKVDYLPLRTLPERWTAYCLKNVLLPH
jgi:hypothetical protein